MKNKISAAGLPKIAPSNMAFCQPIIPLAFDNSLSYYEFVAKINGKLNETICVVNRQNGFLFDFQKAVDIKLNAFNTELVNFKTEWEDYQTEINGVVTTINYKATEALDTANAAAETATAAQASATGAANAATNAATAAETAQAAAEAAAAQAATYNTRIEALESQHVGRISPAGDNVTIDGATYTYGSGAEYFNEYEGATKNNAVGNNSHASGGSSNAIGDYSFAHGGACNAGGDYSATFGRENYAEGDNSFTAGKMNQANGDNSAVFGIGNTASAAGGFVCGEYADTDNNTAFAVGNGTSSTTGNAFEVDKSGYQYNPANATGYRIAAPLTQAEYDLIQNPDSRTIYIIIPAGA